MPSTVIVVVTVALALVTFAVLGECVTIEGIRVRSTSPPHGEVEWRERSRAVVVPKGHGGRIAVNEAQGPATERRGWPQ